LKNIKDDVLQTPMIKVIIGPVGCGKTYAIKKFLQDNSNLYEMKYFNIADKYFSKSDTNNNKSSNLKLKDFWEKDFYPSIVPNYLQSNDFFDSFNINTNIN